MSETLNASGRKKLGLLAAKSTPNSDVTTLLEAWRDGDSRALALLMEVVQQELLLIARGLFRFEREGHTLQPTVLVNEVYLKLESQEQVSFHCRAEFFAVAARLMRRVLVDHARRYESQKRGGDVARVSFDEAVGLPDQLAPEILALDLALADLARRSERQSRIVEMRLLVGLRLEEIAALENVSPSTVSRDWKAAKLFLFRQLSGSA